MINIKNVSKYYSNNGNVSLGLRNINLNFNAGEIVAITGDSGSGKSTLLNVITAVDAYDEGEIYFCGNETSYFNQDDMDLFRKNNVSFIFQNYNIIDSYTVLDNVMIPLLLRGLTLEEAKEKALDIIDKVGLSNRAKNKGTKLSGGEKQRCVIARALASDAKILACDEPTGNLDSETGAAIIQLIKDVAKDKLVLIVTHNYSQVQDIVTRRIKVSDGEIIEDVQLISTDAQEETNTASFEERRFQKKAFLSVAFKNIFSTPRKTIFSFFVFLVMSSIIFSLSLLSLQYSYESKNSDNPMYAMISKDRLVAFDTNHKALDADIVRNTSAYESYENAFYEEMEGTIISGTGNTFSLCFTNHRFKYEMKYGVDALNQNEFIIVYPEQSSLEQRTKAVRSVSQSFYYYYNNKGTSFGKLVGIATSSEILKPYVISYDDVNEQFIAYLYNQLVVPYYQIEGQGTYRMPQSQRIVSEYSYISCPTKLEGKVSFDFLFNNMYSVEYRNIPVVYEDTMSELEPYFILKEDFGLGVHQPSFKGIYEAIIYSNDVQNSKNHLTSNGIQVTVPAQYNVITTLNIIYLYMFLGIMLVTLVALFFISYVVLARVYASKNKDYGILRTLGMVKVQLKRISCLEILTIGLSASMVSFIVLIIVGQTTDLLPFIAYLNTWIILAYIGIMALFSFFIAKKFNKRLFKLSVNTTLKGEVARND